MPRLIDNPIVEAAGAAEISEEGKERKGMKYHPASELFPLMEGEEFQKLKEDIQKNGCKQPIIILDDMILDGRNRWRACQELGIQPKEFQYGIAGNPVEYVLSMNLHRRHLTPSQRAMIAAEASKMFAPAAKERQLAGKGAGGSGGRGRKRPDENLVPKMEQGLAEPKGRSIKRAAKLMHVSPSYAQAAQMILNTDPNMAKQVKAGNKTISKAIKETRSAVVRDETTIISGLKYANLAIINLENIREDDPEREQAFDLVESWISNNIERPGDEESDVLFDGKRRMATYWVKIRIDGRNIISVRKEMEKIFPNKEIQIDKIDFNPSRSNRLSEAETLFEESKSIVEDLKGEMENWRESLPENLQDGDKASQIDECISCLEEIESQLENCDFSMIEFPSMMG